MRRPGGTVIDSYVAKNELRYMQSAIAGDYYAPETPDFRMKVLTETNRVQHGATQVKPM